MAEEAGSEELLFLALKGTSSGATACAVFFDRCIIIVASFKVTENQ